MGTCLSLVPLQSPGGWGVTVPQVVREEVASSWGHSSPGWVSRKGLFPRGSF